MTDVAFFCGCFYSFDTGAGACPKCGECAMVRAGPAVTSTERGQQEQPGPAANGAGPATRSRQERADARPDPLAHLAVRVIGQPGTTTARPK
jgi:hypothetical protein